MGIKNNYDYFSKENPLDRALKIQKRYVDLRRQSLTRREYQDYSLILMGISTIIEIYKR